MKLVKANLYNEYLTDIAEHNGFVIKSEDEFSPVSLDDLINNQKFNDNEYRCECGAFIGQELVGHTCPLCNTEIALHSLNFQYTGWIDLGDHHVITPRYFNSVRHIFGANLLRFIMGDYKDDLSEMQYSDKDDGLSEKRKRRQGRPTPSDLSVIIKKIPKAKHHLQGIGLDALYDNWYDIIDECISDKESDTYIMLRCEKEAIFTSKIPVYPTAFRPVTKTSETMFYPIINKYLTKMLSISNKLDSMILEEEIISGLNEIESNWVEGAEFLQQNSLSKKTGFIRSEIVGGAFNFSIRGVVIPDITLRADEIDLPYTSIVNVLIYRITSIFAKRFHKPLEQSYLTVDQHKYDPRVVEIVDELMHSGRYAMMLREPVNNIKSVGRFKIRKYKMHDSTISIPLEVLTGLNADFDGDELDILNLEENTKDIFAEFELVSMYNYIDNTIDFDNKEWVAISAGLITE
jgi:DNA-directed RNA polymerase beta' subunit